MAKEFFSYPETTSLFKLLEETSQRSGVSRAQAFEDFLVMSVCALSGGQMEDQYLDTVKKHSNGEKGKRGCDTIGKMFGTLVAGMEQDTRDDMKDILGDLFQGAITYGEAGQFLTPMPICQMMARMTIGEPAESGERDELEGGSQQTKSDIPNDTPALSEDRERKSVCDPCCGSGRMLLAAAEINRSFELVGQDVDLRCVRMTALNLAFRNLYGYFIWGNTFRLEQKLVYRTGFNGRSFIREVAIESCPAPVKHVIESGTAAQQPDQNPAQPPPMNRKGSQLELFYRKFRLGHYDSVTGPVN